MTASATGFHNDHGIGALFDDVYLLDGRRTPFGKFCGALSTVSPTDLGIHAARAAIAAAGVEAAEV
jgi:acetyl-CoA C-acetyltransferase